MLSSAPAKPSQQAPLGSILSAISKLIIGEQYSEAVFQLTVMIEKYPDNANLHLSRGYLRLYCPKVDFELIDKDFEKAASLKDTKVWHLIRREYFLISPDYRAAATEHKNLLAQSSASETLVYKETFIETLDFLIASSMLTAPDRSVELLKLRAEFSLKSADITIIQQAKKIFATYKGLKYKGDTPTLSFQLFKTGVLKNIPNLLPKELSKLNELVFINLSEALNYNTCAQLSDEEKSLSETSHSKEISFLTQSVYPNFSHQQLSYLNMAITFWLKDDPMIALNKNLCEEVNRLREAPAQPDDDKEFTATELEKLNQNFEYRKSIAFLNKLIAKYPGTRQAYINRATAYMHLDPTKYGKQIDQDLKTIAFLHYIMEYENRYDPEWHKLQCEFSIRLLQPKDALHYFEIIMKKTQDESVKINIRAELLKHFQEAFERVHHSHPTLAYKFFHILTTQFTHLPDHELDLAIIAKIEELFQNVDFTDTAMRDACKGIALMSYPSFYDMDADKLKSFVCTSEEAIKVINLAAKSVTQPLFHQTVARLAKEAGVDSDDISETSMRIELVNSDKLNQKYDKLFADLKALTTKVCEQDKVTPKNINAMKALHDRYLNLLKLIDEALALFDSTDFDNEINFTDSKNNKEHKNKNHNNSNRNRTVIATPKNKDEVPAKQEVLQKKSATPVVSSITQTFAIPDDNDEPFIEVKHKSRTKPPEHKEYNNKSNQRVAPRQTQPSKTPAKPNSIERNIISMINFPPLAPSAAVKPNPAPANINNPGNNNLENQNINQPKPIAKELCVQQIATHGLFSAKSRVVLAVEPTKHLDIEPEVKEPQLKEPKVTLSQTKNTKHYDFFSQAPQKQEEKTPQIASAQYSLLLDKIRILEQSNAYLNYVGNMNTLWRVNLGMQLGSQGIPLTPPFIMSQEMFIEWQMNQLMAQQQTHPTSNGFGNSG